MMSSNNHLFFGRCAVKRHRPIVSPYVGALPVERCRIVARKKASSKSR